jgi:hypothetical protein
VSTPCRTIWLRVLASTMAACLAADWSIAAQDAFHITLGTTGDPDGRNADGLMFVAQTDSGDIVVAGQGASRWSDDGGNNTAPLIARIQANGKLRWQRVYNNLQNYRVTALISQGEEQYAVLEQPEFGPNSVERLTLRRIDRRGALSNEIGALAGVSMVTTIPVVDGDTSYFLLAAKRGATSQAAYAADVQLLQLDLKGQITELDLPSGMQSIDHLLHLGKQEFLIVPRWQGTDAVIADPKTYQSRSDFMLVNRTGKAELLFTLINKQCHRVAASENRIYCAEYLPFQDGGAIVAYSLAGAELWRHDLGPAPMGPVQQILALASGELIYSLRDVKDAIVVGLSPQGSEAWSQTVHSTGQYTFVSAIESLEDGRLVFLGSTGRWNGFGSTDTDAMVLVTSESGGGLYFPQIVSTVTSVR